MQCIFEWYKNVTQVPYNNGVMAMQLKFSSYKHIITGMCKIIIIVFAPKSMSKLTQNNILLSGRKIYLPT